MNDTPARPECDAHVPVTRREALLSARRKIDFSESAISRAEREKVPLPTGDRYRIGGRRWLPAWSVGRCRCVVGNLDFAVLARGGRRFGRRFFRFESDGRFVKAARGEEKQRRHEERRRAHAGRDSTQKCTSPCER